MNKKNILSLIFWIIIIGILIFWVSSNFNNSFNTTNQSRVPEEISSVITKDEALNLYWDEIKEYINGLSNIEACQDENCYFVKAQISNGIIEKINFNNGNYLYVTGEIEFPNGYSSDIVEGGELWDFTFDMTSPLVDYAIQAWADNNNYIIK
jgi:hypothetical protein